MTRRKIYIYQLQSAFSYATWSTDVRLPQPMAWRHSSIYPQLLKCSSQAELVLKWSREDMKMLISAKLACVNRIDSKPSTLKIPWFRTKDEWHGCRIGTKLLQAYHIREGFHVTLLFTTQLVVVLWNHRSTCELQMMHSMSSIANQVWKGICHTFLWSVVIVCGEIMEKEIYNVRVIFY